MFKSVERLLHSGLWEQIQKKCDSVLAEPTVGYIENKLIGQGVPVISSNIKLELRRIFNATSK